MPNDFFFARRRPTTSGVAFRACLAPSGRRVPGALAGWAQKVAKKVPRGTYREIIVFWRPSSKVATKCSFVLPGAGPWHQPVRTLGVTAAMHCTVQTTLMLRILLNMHRGTIRRRAPHKAQRPSDRSLRDLRWAWPVAVLEWTTSPLQYGGICLRRHQHSCSNSDIVSVRSTDGNVPKGLHED